LQKIRFTWQHSAEYSPPPGAGGQNHEPVGYANVGPSR
jgi:hypothetical protein